MENEIKVNDYIRTEECGIIWKVYDKDGVHYSLERVVDGQKYTEIVTHEYLESRIKNHSSNIIDLIEKGDYVNGLEVLDIYIPRDLWEKIEIRVNDKYTNFVVQEDIESIVTKEHFKSGEYRI